MIWKRSSTNVTSRGFRGWCTTIILLALLIGLLALPGDAMARTLTWSGYTWNVRPPGYGGPGPNQWSDSAANVQTSGSELLISIVRDASGQWTSSEIDNQRHLGYGTYTWIVNSNLSTLDANDVLGMFTYGGSSSSNNEIDIEASHWGSLGTPIGSATVWRTAWRNASRTFTYSARPPYVNRFTWSRGRIVFRVTDATGAVLLNWTVNSGVPVPSTEVPIINYWRYQNVAPAAAHTIRIASFSWTP